MPLKRKNKNRLFVVRKKNGLAQKQVAQLLGHKAADLVSRYERGLKLPSLKTALKLQIIYRLPIHTLFYQYYQMCLQELAKQAKVAGSKSAKTLILGEDFEFCSYAELLKPLSVSHLNLEKVKSHVSRLITNRSERMNHRAAPELPSKSAAESNY